MNKRVVTVGNIKIGGDNPVSIQSMTNTDTRDVEATVAQILRLEEAGCGEYPGDGAAVPQPSQHHPLGCPDQREPGR